MINPRQIWQKVKRDQALNLSELAVASGYDRGKLSRMLLPLQEKKISLSDFKRVMRRRQNVFEANVFELHALPDPAAKRLAGASSPAGADLTQATADKFDAPSSKRAKRGASRPLPQSQLRNTA